MKALNKISTLILLFTLLILTSCQKENLYEAEENNSHIYEVNTRTVTGYQNSLTTMCTISRDCLTADPFGGCLILFPPEPVEPDFGFNVAIGSAFVNENGNLSFNLNSNLALPEESQNTLQDFQISNMIVPADIAEELFGSSSPGEIILNDGNFDAQVGDDFLSLSVPSNAGEVEIMIWYNGTSNN